MGGVLSMLIRLVPTPTLTVSDEFKILLGGGRLSKNNLTRGTARTATRNTGLNVALIQVIDAHQGFIAMKDSTTFHNARVAGPATAPSGGGGGKPECSSGRFHTPKTPRSGERQIGAIRTKGRSGSFLNANTHAHPQRNGPHEGWRGLTETARPPVGHGAEQAAV